MKTRTFLLIIPFAIINLLCYAQHPILWGTTQEGALGFGVIFNYNTATGREIIVEACDTPHGLALAGALMQASNGLLYGMTQEGGTNDDGVLFSYRIQNDQYSEIHNFGFDFDGAFPAGGLVQVGDSLLYGTTGGGGNDFGGTIFSYNIAEDTEIVLHDFIAGIDGSNPTGSLLLANNGLLYGLTLNGGANGSGTLFSYSINSSTLVTLHNFSFAGDSDGFHPSASLIQSGNGLLYGVTQQGGANGSGILFGYDVNLNKYNILHVFGNDTDGTFPSGPLVAAGNGLLYGTTTDGGTNGEGIIFSYNLQTGAYSGVYNFGSNAGDALIPIGGLMQASDNLIYGMASGGGANAILNAGAIFSYNTATGSEAVVHSFNLLDGQAPSGTLTEVDEVYTHIAEAAVETGNLQIFPNPSTGKFTIHLQGNFNNYPADIYNALGEKIEHVILHAGQITLNLGNRAAGMYFVCVQTAYGVKTGKLMIGN